MREKILDCAEAIVQNKGLEAVSFQQLADAVGLSKASVFHHFRNSEALALALVGRCRSKYGEEYAAIAGKKLTAPKKLREVAASFEDGLRQDRLCLLAALGSSQPTLTESIREELKETAKAAGRTLERIYDQGREEGSLKFAGSSEDAARGFLALLQGLQQLARYSNDLDLFSPSVESYLTSLET